MPLLPPTPKLAIALQVWDGDVQTGKRLTKLICDIEPEKRDDIEFIVSARRGTNTFAVADIVAIAKTKFASVTVIQCKRRGTGWPEGPGDLWQETMMRIWQMRETSKVKADGVLTFEADCIPLRPDWLDVLAEEWRNRKPKTLAVGHAHIWSGDPKGEPTHINGNAMFDCEILRHHPIMNGSDATAGWDAYHGELLLKIGQDTFAISQTYRLREATTQQVMGFRKRGRIPAMWHGLKNGIGIDAIDAMIADGNFYTRNLEPESEVKLCALSTENNLDKCTTSQSAIARTVSASNAAPTSNPEGAAE